MEKTDILLSVVVPVFNRAAIVGPTLESIASQRFRNFELILVDNASTDGTAAVLLQWQKRILALGIAVEVLRCPTPGASAARNTGLGAARAPWVLFFDSDDTMPPTHLQRAAEAIGAHPGADIIGWDTLHMARDGSCRRGRFFGTNMQKHSLFDGAMATQRWCARTALVRDAGAWDENVGYWDDIELGARILATGPAVVYIGASGVKVMESEGSITGSPADHPARMEPALTRIEATLGPKGRRWCRLKRAIEYARCSRAGSPEGRKAMAALRPGPWLWLIYHYTRLGGRGAAHLFT